MNRLKYWLSAKTVYHLHSPYLYQLYGEVLGPRLSRRTRIRLRPPRRYRQYHEEVYKLSNHFQVPCECVTDNECQFTLPDGSQIAVVRAPHRNKGAEQHWRQRQQEQLWRVSLDMYDVGVLLSNPRLSRQQIVLKRWGW
ncbi:MAG: hypothetical protein SPJ13_01645 [Bacteroidales bacterium]|nr:hypothetical protein [Bacteroidales bacterium]